MVEEHKYNPVLPAVALHNPRWGDWRESMMECLGVLSGGTGPEQVVSLDRSKGAAIYISFGSAIWPSGDFSYIWDRGQEAWLPV